MGRRSKAQPVHRALPEDRIVVDAEVVDSWLHVASTRERHPWDEVEKLLEVLKGQYPFQARLALKYIHWLRQQALAFNLDWGKDYDNL